jgi:hypothetical protein
MLVFGVFFFPDGKKQKENKKEVFQWQKSGIGKGRISRESKESSNPSAFQRKNSFPFPRRKYIQPSFRQRIPLTFLLPVPSST